MDLDGLIKRLVELRQAHGNRLVILDDDGNTYKTEPRIFDLWDPIDSESPLAIYIGEFRVGD